MTPKDANQANQANQANEAGYPFTRFLTSMYYRLIYTSKAAPGVDYERLLADSQRRNASFGVTGGLAIVDAVFLQYLEGDEAEVEWLFHKILADDRHHGVKVLERRAVSRRMFETWTMASLHWCDETRMIFESFSPGIGLDLYRTDPSTAAPLFRAWAATEHWQAHVRRPVSPPPGS